MPEDTNSELENFRNQWREEVTARSKSVASSYHKGPAGPSAPKKTERSLSNSTGPPRAKTAITEEEEEHPADSTNGGYHDLEDKDEARRLGTDTEGIHPSNQQFQKPRSALEFYEKAVEREMQGSLGDSLSHYRKAFRVLSTTYSSSNRRLIISLVRRKRR